ncbi:biotin/lipoyl-containing protein, partial [Corynebacterium sanguinis]
MQTYNLPDVGEGLTEAEIVQWHVKPGDAVAVNDVVAEIETAKSLVELPSPFAGTVSELLVAEGETVAVGTPILAVSGESDVPAPEAPQAPAAESSTGASDAGGSVLVGYGTGGEVQTRRRKAPREKTVAAAVGVVAKPPIRKLARDLGIELSDATATGAAGEVTRDDVLRHAEQAKVFRNLETPQWPEERERRIPAPPRATPPR